jgi:hypothetical protein
VEAGVPEVESSIGHPDLTVQQTECFINLQSLCQRVKHTILEAAKSAIQAQ